jgi:hypothetical protein
LPAIGALPLHLPPLVSNWNAAGNATEKMGRLPASAYQEEAGMTLRGPPESLEMESTKDTAPTEAIGCILFSVRSQNGNPGLFV